MIVKQLTLENDKEEKFEVEIYLNLASIKNIEKELKVLDKNYNFYKALPLIDKGELSVTLTYICNMVHLKDRKAPVGVDWFDDNNIDFLKYSKDLVGALAQCLADNKPTAESKKK